VQINSTGSPLTSNLWYTVIVRNLAQGSNSLAIEVNGSPISFTSSSSSGVSFAVFNGPLFIGGIPDPTQVQYT